jgi:1,2-diacylglycerol 3-alpha-glucosyltransferase
MKRSVVFFNDSFPPVIDGVANVVLNYARTLGDMGWDCTVVTPNAPGTPRGEDVEVLRYKSLPLVGRDPYRVGLPYVDIGFKRKLNKINPDIIHVHCPFTSGWLGLDFARERKIPVVGTFHSQYAYDFKNAVQLDFLVNIFLSAVVRFYNKVDYVWVPNDFAGKALKSYGYNGKYLCMPNGTDFINDDDIAGMQQKGGRILGAKPGEFILMFVGRLVKEKNLMLLCEVMNELIKKGTLCKLALIGEGYYTKDLKEYSRKHKLDNYIHFMGPVYDRDKLKCAISRADLFVFPSLYDIASLALLEAASLSVPLMLLPGNAIADKIQNEVNGFLCPNDAAEWAAMITRLMSDKELLVSAGKNGQKDLVKNWPVIIEEVEAHYVNYINHRQARNKSELL